MLHGAIVVVTLTSKLEATIAPLFASLGRRMLARCRGYPRDQISVLRNFLTDCARDMRDETAKLTQHVQARRRA
jgi:hypothetical protein